MFHMCSCVCIGLSNWWASSQVGLLRTLIDCCSEFWPCEWKLIRPRAACWLAASSNFEGADDGKYKVNTLIITLMYVLNITVFHSVCNKLISHQVLWKFYSMWRRLTLCPCYISSVLLQDHKLLPLNDAISISTIGLRFCSLEPFWIWQRQKNNNLEIDWSFSWNFISFAKAKPKQIKNCEIYSCSDLNAKLNSALKFTKAVQNDDQTYLYYWLKLLVLSVTHKDSILNCNPKIVLF